MSMKIDTKTKNLKMVQLSFMTALIVVLQLLAALLVRVGAVAPTLSLIPIVIGGAALGCGAGAFLGFVFGLIAFICGITGLDAFTNMMFSARPVETVCICLLKGVLCGLLGAVAYKLLSKATKGKLFPSVLVSSVIVPVVNTAVYVFGMAVFFRDFITDNQGNPLYTSNDGLFIVVGGVIVIIIGNFLLELVVNAICCPALAGILSKTKQYKSLFNSNK